MQYAGFWVRVGAYLIDFVILVVAQFIVLMLFGQSDVLTDTTSFSANASSESPFLNLLLILFGIAYFVGFESSNMQATPGKRALGLMVIDYRGRKISVPRAIGRYFAKILSGLILLIGYIMVAFTDRKQGLHDVIASTLVIHSNPGESGVDASVFE
jgi:uncharacterized RDD family membrane protein YckC